MTMTTTGILVNCGPAAILAKEMDVRDEEILALSWDNYAKQFHDKLSQLWHKEKYTDATITCEGKFYSVHKIVLSTCSQFFERVFEYTVGKHPVVVLPDVKQFEIEALLKFMYDGVLQIARKDLPRLMKVADLLKIRSLCGPEEWTADDTSPKEDHASSVDRVTLAAKTTRSCEIINNPPCNKKRKQEEERLATSFATQTYIHHPQAYEVHKPQETTYQTTTLRIPGEAVSEIREISHDNLGIATATSVMSFETDRQYHHGTIHNTTIPKDIKTEVAVKDEFMEDVSSSQNAAIRTEAEEADKDANATGEAFLPQQPDLTELSHAEAVHPLSEDIAGPSGVHEDMQLQAAVEVVMGVAEGEEEESLYTHSPQSGQWEGESATTSSKPIKKSQARQATVNYTCPFCNKLFLDKFKCSRHMYAHTGEKPFICNICARRFSRKDNLQKHMKDKHKLFRGQFSLV